MTNCIAISHPDEIRPGAKSFGWLKFQIVISSRWHGATSYVIRITPCIDHMPSGWLNLNSVMSSGLLRVTSLYHPDDILHWPYVIRMRELSHSDDLKWHWMSSGWHTTLSTSHPDDLLKLRCQWLFNTLNIAVINSRLALCCVLLLLGGGRL